MRARLLACAHCPVPDCWCVAAAAPMTSTTDYGSIVSAPIVRRYGLDLGFRPSERGFTAFAEQAVPRRHATPSRPQCA